MINLYLFCLILGGGLVLLSLLGGGEGGGDVDGELGVDVEGDLGADLDVEGDLGADPEVETGDVGQAGSVGNVLLAFLNLRLWTFFGAFFGLTGTSLTLLGQASEERTLISSIGVGLFSAIACQAAYTYARSREVSSELSTVDLRGRTAEVIVAFGGTSVGKVRLEIQDSQIEYLAIDDRAEGQRFEIGTLVRVIDYLDGELRVVRQED